MNAPAWRGPDYEGEFASLGWAIIDWIENYLIHGPGDVQGEPIVIDDEMAEFIVRCYEIDPITGRRVKKRAFLSRPKGRAKSEVAGMLSVVEFIGPARFDHWDEDGEPVGKPVKAPVIRCLATEEGQAGNTYDNVRVMLEHIVERFGDEFPGIDVGLTRVFRHGHGGGEIIPSTASNSAKDGGKETFATFDETHLYVLPELKRMHATVRRNLGKRKAADPWSLETSTMYRPGEGSVAEDTHAYAKQIAEGKVKTQHLLFDHREAPQNIDLSDHEQLLAGLRYVYGPAADWMDLEGIIADIWDPQSDPSDSRRYWLNQVVAATDSWLSEQEWAARSPKYTDPKRVVVPGDTIVMGFDGSRKRKRGVTDATALIGCRVSDGHLFEIGVWEQPEGPAGEDWEVPVALVDAAVAHAFATYTVVGFYADPAKWESTITDWEVRFGGKLQIRASKDHPIFWWMTGGRAIATVRALELFENAVIDGDLTHDGSYALTRHALNARRAPTRSGLQIRKEHPDSPKKIDAIVAAVLAFQCRTDALAAGVTAKPKRSKTVHRF